MQSHDDEPLHDVVDNAVILMSLLITRFVMKKSGHVFPPRIRKRLLIRINELIKQYKNPSRGIEYDDSEQNP
jgi:hypothetical protein